MRRHRILLVLTALLVGVVVLQEPAGADCAGPTFRHDTGEFASHGTLTVTGEFFGDNCYDTGPPPEGEGVLGRPIDSIEVLLIQGDREWVVATGNAGPDYAFAVEIVIPADVTAGEATIAVRWPSSGGALPSTLEPITLVEVDTGEASVEPATFGPREPNATTTTAPPTEEASPPADPGADDDSGRARWIAVGMVIAAAAIGGLLVLSKR